MGLSLEFERGGLKMSIAHMDARKETYSHEVEKRYGVDIRFFILNFNGDIKKQLQYIKKHKINCLSISTHENYDLLFDTLKKIDSGLLGLHLTGWHGFEDLDFLLRFQNLKQLRLGLHPQLKKAFDLTQLPELEDLTLLYSKKFKNLFRCHNLKKLDIEKLDHQGAIDIQYLTKLEEVNVVLSNVKSLEGFSKLHQLKTLTLRYLPKLESIAPIKNLANIEWLFFQNCKRVADWEVISSLTDLKTIYFENCGILEDIYFLKPLEKLETVGFIGSGKDMKIVNGNVSWLYDKPTVDKIMMGCRRKYFDVDNEKAWYYQRGNVTKLFQFKLKSPLSCVVSESQKDDRWIDWNALTVSEHFIKLKDVKLFEFSPQYIVKYNEPNKYLAEQYIGFFGDIFSVLPFLACPMPEDLYRLVDTKEKIETLWRKICIPKDRSNRAVENLCMNLIAYGGLETISWNGGSHLQFFRVNDDVNFHYNLSCKDEDGIPYWTAGKGIYTLPYKTFLSEVEDLLNRFFLEMEKQVLFITKTFTQQELKRANLAVTHDERKKYFYNIWENVKQGKYENYVDWEQVREDLAFVLEESE